VIVELDYGRGRIALRLPEAPADVASIEVLEKTAAAPLADPDAALRDGLAEPIRAPALRALARGRRDAVIVVSDRTRPVPNARLLPPILAALADAGLPPERIHVQIATGLHRAATPAELDEILGPVLAGSLPIVQHDARDAAAHVDLGRTASGLPIQIDRFYLERDLRILTGLVEPHLMAGYSGGRKAVCPGLASAETIRVAHGPAMLEGRIGPGIVDGNPLHEALVEVLRRTGADFLVNVSLDRERRISGVFCGDPVAAHEAAMRFVEAESHVSVGALADLVVVSAGGDPLDATFYQAIKGVAAAVPIVRPGGAILLCASLREGIGSASFEKCLRESGGPDAFERRLGDERFFAIDQWMVQHLCQALRRAHVYLWSDGLPAEAQRALFVEPVASPEEGVARALARVAPGGRARIAVIPQGPYVLATHGGVKTPLGRGAAAAG